MASADILTAIRELTNAKQLDRAELQELLEQGIKAALEKKYGPTVQSEVRIDGERGTINITLLKTARDWQRFVGRRANVTSAALGGRQEVEIVAVEAAPDGDGALLRDAKGNEHRVPLTAVTEARLAFHWKPEQR